jgi:GNAT superfamily N-acetyltransferase
VVDEAHRSGGVGRALLGAAEAWAREHGCEVVTVRSRVARERAHRFYEREGYVRVKTSHVFSKPLV